MGCSAGGLLVGAVVNMLPNLFSAAVLKVNLWAHLLIHHYHLGFAVLIPFSLLLLVNDVSGLPSISDMYLYWSRSPFLISAIQCWILRYLSPSWTTKNLVTLISQLNLMQFVVVLLMTTYLPANVTPQFWWLPLLMIQGLPTSLYSCDTAVWIICSCSMWNFQITTL